MKEKDSMESENSFESLEALAERSKNCLTNIEANKRIFLNGFNPIHLAHSLIEEQKNRACKVTDIRNLTYQANRAEKQPLPPPQASPIDYSRSPPILDQANTGSVIPKHNEFENLPSSFCQVFQSNAVGFRESGQVRNPLRRKYSSPSPDERAAKYCRLVAQEPNYENSFRVEKSSGPESTTGVSAFNGEDNSTRYASTNLHSKSDLSSEEQSKHFFNAYKPWNVGKQRAEKSPLSPESQLRTARTKSDGDVASSIPVFVYPPDKSVFDSENLQSTRVDSQTFPCLTSESLAQLYPWILARYLNKAVPVGTSLGVLQQNSFLQHMTQKITEHHLRSYYHMTSPNNCVTSSPSSYQATSPLSPSEVTLPSPNQHIAMSSTLNQITSTLSPSHMMTSQSLKVPQQPTKLVADFSTAEPTSSRAGCNSPSPRPFSSSSPDSGCPEVVESEADRSPEDSDSLQRGNNEV